MHNFTAIKPSIKYFFQNKNVEPMKYIWTTLIKTTPYVLIVQINDNSFCQHAVITNEFRSRLQNKSNIKCLQPIYPKLQLNRITVTHIALVNTKDILNVRFNGKLFLGSPNTQGVS